jgi:peptide deformylase
MKYTRKNIITLPDPTLREKSAKIREITPEIREIIAGMKAAAIDWENSRPHEAAVALAAVQVAQLWRIVIIREDFEDKDNQNFTVLINPEIVKTEGTLELDDEGCLSVAGGVYGRVPRWTKVRVKALDEQGYEVRFKSPNPFLARVLQHEIDHTNGVMFVDHIAHDEDAFELLNDKGELVPADFAKIAASGILPTDEENHTIAL